jgi:hypothetical protein
MSATLTKPDGDVRLAVLNALKRASPVANWLALLVGLLENSVVVPPLIAETTTMVGSKVVLIVYAPSTPPATSIVTSAWKTSLML